MVSPSHNALFGISHEKLETSKSDQKPPCMPHLPIEDVKVVDHGYPSLSLSEPLSVCVRASSLGKLVPRTGREAAAALQITDGTIDSNYFSSALLVVPLPVFFSPKRGGAPSVLSRIFEAKFGSIRSIELGCSIFLNCVLQTLSICFRNIPRRFL